MDRNSTPRHRIWTQLFDLSLATNHRILNRIGLFAVMLISLAYQLAITGYQGDDRATTPDSPGYLEPAAEI